MNSDHVGVGTWITSLYSPDGKELTRGSCEDRSEWAAVKQLLVQTKATEPSNGKATDEATLWGTVPAGSQIASNLYEQIGEVTDSDKHLATAGPIGLNQGIVNGVVVTLPTVSYKTSPDADAVYFVEVVYDLDGNVIAQGKRGVESETIRLTTPTPPVTPPTGAGRNAAGNGGNGAAANVPIVSG